ncbi:hypothetical protein HUN41_00153 [Streptomyces phage Coruscant]|uniref:Uncharacterized protein n=1 Tax=Streptomyces phage Coruscant TaxID=2739834 RepID=A0A7G4AW72_9CAUD|nr:hypothetical protein PP454_gp155 [Streptomyces phage Coruscant]QMP84262.1 hypothetical protein HUN41_00153 [Streptomyces phage Coruscant]
MWTAKLSLKIKILMLASAGGFYAAGDQELLDKMLWLLVLYLVGEIAWLITSRNLTVKQEN